MPVIVSHNSALEWYRANPFFAQQARRTSEPIAIPRAVGDKGASRITPGLTQRMGLQARPIHLLLRENVHSSRSAERKFHRTSLEWIPAGLAFDLGEGYYVCSPELLFVQMAKHLSPLATLVLAYELCGSYSHFSALISGFYKRAPLTCVDRLHSTLDQIGPMHGKQRAGSALRFASDGSASPMETLVACALTLNAKHGGQGLFKATLN